MEILNESLIPVDKKGSGIHIKKKNRGKFTEYCGGEVTQKCIDKAKKSKNPTLRKRATFADNARKWKHTEGGTLISKHQTGTGKDGIIYSRLDVDGLRKDPDFVKEFNLHMNDKNLSIAQDSLIGRNANFAQRIAILSNIISESGGETKPHGNGAHGLIGWRSDRAYNLPTTLDGQLHYLMTETFANPSVKNWHHGGDGTGVNTGKEMYNLFNTTQNVNQATAAYTRGFVRPPSSEYERRKTLAQLIKKYMK